MITIKVYIYHTFRPGMPFPFCNFFVANITQLLFVGPFLDFVALSTVLHTTPPCTLYFQFPGLCGSVHCITHHTSLHPILSVSWTLWLCPLYYTAHLPAPYTFSFLDFVALSTVLHTTPPCTLYTFSFLDFVALSTVLHSTPPCTLYFQVSGFDTTALSSIFTDGWQLI